MARAFRQRRLVALAVLWALGASLAKNANAKLPYDPLKDFVPIVEYGRYPVAIFVSNPMLARI